MLLLHGVLAYNDIIEKMIMNCNMMLEASCQCTTILSMTRTLCTIACKREGKTEILAQVIKMILEDSLKLSLKEYTMQVYVFQPLDHFHSMYLSSARICM